MITCTFEDGGSAKLRHAVTDVILVKDGKILLVQRAARLVEGGKWAFPAGYLDRDETVMQAAKREVLEETGWKMTDITLFMIADGPQPGDRGRQNISFIFTATATEKVGEADDESEDVRWFPLDNLPPAEQIAFNHGDIINAYKDHLANPRPVSFFNEPFGAAA
jgi:ADP-ribose pyrophosphatase YjhB (NUDIX family)